MAAALRLTTLLLLAAWFVSAQCFSFADADTGNCNFSAIFNFGDSNSDTGGLVAGMGLESRLPNGETFFKKPTDRYCDGRLIVDFLCVGFQFPFLSAYLESVGSSFRHGANYACAGSTFNRYDTTFSLPVQVNQFRRFKARVLDVISQGFEHPLAACCGYGGLPYNFKDNLRCSESGIVNGRLVTDGACKDPSPGLSTPVKRVIARH